MSKAIPPVSLIDGPQNVSLKVEAADDPECLMISIETRRFVVRLELHAHQAASLADSLDKAVHAFLDREPEAGSVR